MLLQHLQFQCRHQQMNRWMVAVLMCMHSGFPAGSSELTIMMSWNDIMTISHAIEGRNYKRRAQPDLRAVIWVFWYQAFRSINKPQTLYFSCLSASRGEEHNQNGMCDLFIHMHVPRPFWGILSWCDFSCLTVAGLVTTYIPLNLVWSEAQITTLW